jgi:predicted YcjX-like family ATPase
MSDRYHPPEFTQHHHVTVSLSDDLTALLRQSVASILQEIRTMSGSMDAAIATLTARVDAQTSVDTAALKLIQGIPAMLKTAFDAAVASGATQAQVQSVTDLGNRLQAASQPLADAVTANIPAA